MGKDYIASRESALLVQTSVIAGRIGADPGAWGIPPDLAADYVARQLAFSQALQTALDLETRTRSAVQRKNLTRRNLVHATRTVAQMIRANPALTDAQRLDLGLPARRRSSAPRPVPAGQPVLAVVARMGTIITLRLHDGAGHPRPADATSAHLFSHVGPTPPPTATGWHFEGAITRRTAQVRFDPSLPPGTPVWFFARWHNPRGAGPGCAPLPTTLPGGALTAAA